MSDEDIKFSEKLADHLAVICQAVCVVNTLYSYAKYFALLLKTGVC